MLRLSVSDKVEKFRGDFRAFLAKHTPPQANDSSLGEFIRVGRAWQKTLSANRFVAVHWPEQFGGRGLSLVEEAVIQEELVRARAPQLLGLFGLTMVGPVLIQHGTTEQKKRFLPKILSAEEVWCQGFSEPGAGSDLAAIKTKAEITPEGFLITGQKIWTSFAHIADWCFVLCRTGSTTQKKYEGLTYLLVNMKEQGITTRPLRQISGDDEFNEVFFDKVFVPKDQVVGQVGEGWKIAISTLMYERVVLTFARQLQSEVALRDLIARHQNAEPNKKTELAQRVVRACAVRALAYKHLSDYAKGKTPGPEGSLDKLFWSESFQDIAKLSLALEGEEAAGSEQAGLAAHSVHRYLYSRGRTIAAGTSEIQRSIIAERLLGLPKSR